MKDPDGKLLEGAIFFAIVAIAVLGGAYAMWPPEFFGTPFADMTPAMMLRAAATAVLVFIGAEFLGALVIVSQSDR